MLVEMKDILQKAYQNSYAVGAFNITSYEALQATLRAAEELGAPVILQYAQIHSHLIAMEDIAPAMLYCAERAKVPVAVHLDHGHTFDCCVQAIRQGFTSIMYDASGEPYEENVARTKELARIAHAAGVTIEAELGHIYTSEIVIGEGTTADCADDYDDLDSIYTSPEAAAQFVEETGVDCLAVAIGTTHGVYKEEPKLDFVRLGQIRRATEGTPLVMHGGSGISQEDIHRCIRGGIAKINYYTYMNKTGGAALREYVQGKSPEEVLFLDEMSLHATAAMKEDVMAAIQVFSCSKKTT